MKTLPMLKPSHPFLTRMSPAHSRTLLHHASRQEFQIDEVLFTEGAPANRFYLVESGEIAIETSSAGTGPVLIQIVGPGEILGWSWMFPPFAWHFSARTLSPTTVICCDAAHLLVTSEEDTDFGYHLMKLISNIVIQRLQATRRRLIKAESVLPAASAVLHK